jgi:hypothetical protein
MNFQPAQMPHRSVFNRLLSNCLGALAAAELVNSASEKYPALVTACPSTPDRMRITKQVLPALAMYHAMLSKGIECTAALQLLEPVVLEAYFGRLRRGLVLFSKLPLDPFTVLRPALRRMVRPVEGYSGDVIENSRYRLVVHTRQCAILDALRYLGAPELAIVFCASDDWLVSALPRVRWLRTTTLAMSGPHCDFHWERA